MSTPNSPRIVRGTIVFISNLNPQQLEEPDYLPPVYLILKQNDQHERKRHIDEEKPINLSKVRDYVRLTVRRNYHLLDLPCNQTTLFPPSFERASSVDYQPSGTFSP